MPKNLLICYGTSTGTAREVALRIAREAYSFSVGSPPNHHFSPEVLQMNSVNVDYLVENWTTSASSAKQVIFVISTTGQGEFPDDSKSFWKSLLRKDNPELNINFSVIALGDSSYEYYNYPGKKLHRRLSQLSGISQFPICLCDDQHDLGYVGALNSFLETIWSSWLPPEYLQSRNLQPVPRYKLSTTPPKVFSPTQDSKVVHVPVYENIRVTDPSHFQDTRLITLDTSSVSLSFEPCDVLQVYPQNSQETVERFFSVFPHLQNQPPFYISCDPLMSWEHPSPDMYKLAGPPPWRWETVATHLLSLNSIPGVYLFEILRFFTEDPLLNEKFTELCRPEGLEELYNYVNRPRRTILEIFQDFPSVVSSIPPEYLFDLVPFMRPRAFSICSPPIETTRLEILVAVVEYKTNLKATRKGICSYWLANDCPLGTQIGVFCDKGSLKPPPPSPAHVIMIGPGTGVAPFRSLIKERLEDWKKVLFFGCRHPQMDNYFDSEWRKLEEQGVLQRFTAFSRTDKKEYVQDKLIKEENFVKSLVKSELPLFIYVCGRSGDMPKDVWATFVKIFEDCGVADAEGMLKKMLSSGQYQTETY